MDHGLAVEGIVVVEPADHRAEIERRSDRVEYEWCARHLRAIGNKGARNDRAQEFRAGGIGQRLEAAAQAVDQGKPRGLPRKRALDRVAVDIIGNIGGDFVGCGTNVGGGCGHDDGPCRKRFFARHYMTLTANNFSKCGPQNNDGDHLLDSPAAAGRVFPSTRRLRSRPRTTLDECGAYSTVILPALMILA